MFDFLILAIMNSLVCTGVYVAAKFDNSDVFDDDPDRYRSMSISHKMILWWIRYYGSYLPEMWRKPLYLCLPCMASVWSIPVWSFFTVYMGFGIESVGLWILYVMAVAGLNKIVADNLIYN